MVSVIIVLQDGLDVGLSKYGYFTYFQTRNTSQYQIVIFQLEFLPESCRNVF